MDLKELANKAREMARDMLLSHGEVMPTFFAIDADNKMTIYSCPWGSEEEKYMIFNILKLKFKADKVVAFCFVSEAWTVHRTEEQLKADQAAYRRPADCDDRVEVLVVSGISHYGSIMFGDEILRDGDGKVVGTKPCKGEDAETQSHKKVTGFIPDLLPEAEHLVH